MVAYFYTVGGSTSCSTSSIIARSILRQVVEASARFDEVRKLWEKMVRPPLVETLVRSLLEQVLLGIRSHEVFIVIDALDEAENHYNALSAVLALHEHPDIIVKTIVSGRPTRSLPIQLRSSPRICLKKERSQQDVNSYIVSEIRLWSESRPDVGDALVAEIITSLSQRADGM